MTGRAHIPASHRVPAVRARAPSRLALAILRLLP